MKNQYMNYENETFTEEEILAVTANRHERWRGVIPFKRFIMKRGPRGAKIDTYVEDMGCYQSLSMDTAASLAYYMVQKQEDGFRMLYTPFGLRAYMLHRSLYPTEMTLRFDGEYVRKDTQTLLNDKEWDIIEKFTTKYEAGDMMMQIRWDDQLKWSGDDTNLTYFASEMKCLAGQRTSQTISRYLQKVVPHAPSDDVRDVAAELLTQHQRDDRYQVHIAENSDEIIKMYEQSNVPSCMVRDRQPNETVYIHRHLEDHPVVAYDAPDIQVYGLWDTDTNQYVARAVTRKSRKQYYNIYPTDHSGMKGKVVAKLEAWLDRNSYHHTDEYLKDVELNFVPAIIEGELVDAMCLPYIDGMAQAVAIGDDRAVLFNERYNSARDYGEHMRAYSATNTIGIAGSEAGEYD